MIKKIIKIILLIFLILTIVIFYLSIFGIKTDKLNKQITSNIQKINKKINLSLSDVNYLLNPYSLTINIETKNPILLLEGRNLGIKDIQTNVTLKSLINNQFSIDDLKIKTKEMKLNDMTSLLRIFRNSSQLFILDTIIKEGLISANIHLNFDEKGRVKENYKIEGSIKNAKLNILDQFKFENLNFIFNLEKDIYSIKQIDLEFNDIKISSPLIEIKKDKSLFFVNGQFLNNKKSFDIKELNSIFANLFKKTNINKIEFSSKNNFSFSINKNLKFDNFKVLSTVNLKQLILKEKNSRLKPYLPSLIDNIKFEDHKIVINYNKNKFDIKGSGSILLENKSDNLSYRLIKNNNNILFDSKITLKNNSLLLDFLDYKKREGLSSLISIKGIFQENNQLKFDLIDLKENNNEISIKGLQLNKSFKIVDIKNFDIDYKNNKQYLNKLNLKKKDLDFIIEGESFDASKIINNFMDNDDESSSIFQSLNSNLNIRIKKTYIDEVNYLNNLYGSINFVNNRINDLKLESTFPNEKKINLSIKTNSNFETMTKLSSGYPKPLIKRYDFIKGFEDGYLDFYSTKKGDTSNSVLNIVNFKVKEVPIFAKLLSLASLQGIADVLTGEGIRFKDLEMIFSNQNGLITIKEMYAIGPAVSILMDGYIQSKKIVSLRGTLVPATTINRVIASIPLLGKILVGGKTGEGVFGVSFKLKGPPKNLKTTVNPIKSLTPRFITRTLQKIKKN